MPSIPIAQIAVDQASFSYDKLYTYRWPTDLGQPQAGVRVLVPFGGGNRRRQGLVMAVGETDYADGYKPVLECLDPQPLFTAEMLELIRFLQDRTFCTLFDAVRAMLPTGLYMRLKPVLRPAADVPPEVLDTLTPNERQLLSFVSKCPNGADQATLLKRLGMNDDAPALTHLLEMGVLLRDEDVFRRSGDATVRMVRRVEPDGRAESVTLTAKQQSVLDLLDDVGAASVKEVCYFTGVTAAVIRTLAQKGLAEVYDAETLRSPHRNLPEMPALKPHILNEEQTLAYDKLEELYRSRQPSAALLYGVTGSGKTAVYMNMIDRVLADGQQVIVLVPEISLTPQMMSLFLQKYGRRVAVLHSALAIGERMDEWKRIKRGEAQIVVGTRSAVFAPCDHLGMIVLDEEQEHTYKSESSPRYHARDVARFRCAKQNALLMLTSATPSVESYHAAVSGRYTLLRLDSRYGEVCLPEVQVADMRAEPDVQGSIGSTLRREMQSCLDAGKQIILLLNRRGFHTHVSCRSCGKAVTCPSCSISLTYHRANQRLMCHYCGHNQPLLTVCPSCGSDKLFYDGQGTQLIEQQLEEQFPGVPVLRMDTDTTMSRYSYEERFQAFAQGKYRIMIGTQMVAKGLDFPQVGLVGVLSADQSLYADDYRSYETTFSLLTQVIGRAGRRSEQGKAIIQTYTPDNPIIGLAARQDYDGFYSTEIRMRHMMHYPPYADLLLFGFVGTDETAVRRSCRRMLELMRARVAKECPDLPLIALDPTPAAVARVAGKYRYKMLIKTQNSLRLRELVRQLITDFNSDTANRSVSVYADMNPASML